MKLKKKKTNEELVTEYQKATTEEEKRKIANQLYKKVEKLVIKYAGNFPSISYGEQCDLIQEASLIFMKCIKKFDATKKIKFSTYLGKACKYELRRYKDKQRKHVDNSYFVEIDEIIQGKSKDLDSYIDDKENIEKIQKTLLQLKDRDEITSKQFDTIIDEHGFFDRPKKSRKQISEERKCSMQNVGFLYRKGISRVKEEIDKYSQYTD